MSVAMIVTMVVVMMSTLLVQSLSRALARDSSLCLELLCSSGMKRT
jgi:hypothetical protein